MKPEFTEKLLEWNRTANHREMPWKGERNPYRIWLSEVILQQTRVDQGIKYYIRFLESYPTIRDLAIASDEQVYKLWEGLGYYSRCRNLLATARRITEEFNGEFPSNYEALKQLKGIGPYTAAAISSFAFDQPVAVVDGNVLRIIARYFGISTPVDTAQGKKLFQDLANAMLDVTAPAIYNQAIMDFGATVCKPQPLCEICIQRVDCEAFKHGFVKEVPVKEKAIIRKNRWLYYFILHSGDEFIIRKRTENDIWQNLHEFVLLESSVIIDDPSPFYEFLKTFLGRSEFLISHISKSYKQQLTHQTIHGKFIDVILSSPVNPGADYMKVSYKQLKKLAFPGFINAYLRLKNSRTTLP
ncbi:MAG TPA: A/G-specific adenine glycosylase [Flavitalea sp.]|nr:A/G-specific adenine glycosylase [Flavitalea sp.]